MADTIFTYNGRIPTLGGGNRIPYFDSYDSDAQAFLVATGISDPIISNAVDDLVKGLKNNSLWTKMIAIYPFVGGTATTHKFNLKDPRDLDAAYRLTFTGTITHSSTGATPNGTDGKANTSLNPSSALTNNDTHLSYYSRTSTSVAGGEFGVEESAGNGATNDRIYFSISRTGGTLYSDLYNYGTARLSTANASGSGFYISTRTASNSHKVFKNGIQIGSTNTGTPGTVTDIARPIYLFALSQYNNTFNEYTNKQCAFASIGSGLSDAESSTFNTLVTTFQTTLGRNV